MQEIIIGCDIGGTNCRIAFATYENGDWEDIVLERRIATKEDQNVISVIRDLCDSRQWCPSAICLGVAGAIKYDEKRGDYCEMTNSGWTLWQDEWQDIFGCPVKLVNDMSANAFGIVAGRLPVSKLKQVKKGEGRIGANRVVMSPGTGLGKALLVKHEDSYIPVATEGGHVDFAPRNALQDRLCQFAREKFGRVSSEHIASGIGIPTLYEFFTQVEDIQVSETMAQSIEDTVRANQPIAYALSEGLAYHDALSELIFEMFYSILGAQASDLMLISGGFDGVYLGGGILPKIQSHFLQSKAFIEGFLDKSPHDELVQNCPIWLVTADDTAQRGALAHAAVLVSARHSE